MDYVQQHAELVDAAMMLLDEHLQNETSKSISDALDFERGEYPRLEKLPAKQWAVTFHDFSQRLNVEYSIGTLYSYYEEYICSVTLGLPRSAKHFPVEAVGAQKIDAASLVSGDKTLDQLLGELIVSQVDAESFGRGKAKVIEKITAVKPDQKKKSMALFALDIRNCLVHDNGFVSARFWGEREKLIRHHLDADHVGARISLDLPLLHQSIAWLREHVLDFDACLVTAGFLSAQKKA